MSIFLFRILTLLVMFSACYRSHSLDEVERTPLSDPFSRAERSEGNGVWRYNEATYLPGRDGPPLIEFPLYGVEAREAAKGSSLLAHVAVEYNPRCQTHAPAYVTVGGASGATHTLTVMQWDNESAPCDPAFSITHWVEVLVPLDDADEMLFKIGSNGGYYPGFKLVERTSPGRRARSARSPLTIRLP